jgi:hypothetical protein
MSTSVTQSTYPACPKCGRRFIPGEYWSGANYCRSRFLVELVRDNEGLSAWELSQISGGMTYSDVSKGLQKSRDSKVVTTQAEDREQGGVRYRYSVSPDAMDILDSWSKRGLL